MSKYNTVKFRKNAILMALVGGVGFHSVAAEQQSEITDKERFIVQYKTNICTQPKHFRSSTGDHKAQYGAVASSFCSC